MKKKTLYKKDVIKVYNALQKQRKRIKRRSIFLALFVLGVNAYAWFVFISSASVNVRSNVISWDVNFLDENSEVKDLQILTSDLYPGMDTYTKTIKIKNNSDLRAKFEANIDSINVLGEEVSNSSNTYEEKVDYLKNTYPFIVNITYPKDILNKNDSMDLVITIDWPYEKTDALAREYYKLTNQYKYDDSVIYYKLVNNSYVDAGITSENFNSNKLNLYLEKDDADSYLGYSCKTYKDNTAQSCFNFHLVLTVTQINE